jgi:hypothetical protein
MLTFFSEQSHSHLFIIVFPKAKGFWDTSELFVLFLTMFPVALVVRTYEFCGILSKWNAKLEVSCA